MEKYLDEALVEYGGSDIYPFHMPGHKRQKLGNWSPEAIDITEIDGFDNLHHPEGIIREGQERLAKLFGADESFYLVNGSTGGLLAAICGTVKKGDRILIGRNCHKAVYHAAYLMELKLEYVYPMSTDFGIQGSIQPEQVQEKLSQFPDIAAVVITSPTYDGVVSDIAGIAGVVHEKEITLIVDEAHGAHFGFSGGFPPKAVSLGADLCIESLHKTLPSYTQTAVLHMARTLGSGMKTYRFDRKRIIQYLGIFQTSSPSYVFMAGMDRCVRMLEQDVGAYKSAETTAESLLGKYERRLKGFYDACSRLHLVRIYPYIPAGGESSMETPKRVFRGTNKGVWSKDNSKILISAQAAGLSGQQLYALLLEKYHLQMEMASGHYVTALTSMMDTEVGFDRLLKALEEIDQYERKDSGCRLTSLEIYQPPEKKMELAPAMEAPRERVSLEASVGRISGEFIYLYPPGIPILAPGEELTASVLHLIEVCKVQGLQIQGLEDLSNKSVLVCV